MRAMKVWVLGVIVGGVMVLTQSAYAGGGSWQINGIYSGSAVVAVGETVHVYGEVWLGEDGRGKGGSGFHAGPEHGPFFFYVVHRGSSDWGPFPPPLPEDALYVADVTFESTERSSVAASATFTMPDLEPGNYSLLHCNDPCTRQLGDLMSTPFTLVADPSERRVVERLTEIERRFERRDMRAEELVDDQRGDLMEEIGALRREVRGLEERVVALEQRDGRTVQVGINEAGMLEGGLAAGVVIVLLVAFHFWSTRRT